jgi:hypothetical protein
MCNPCIERDLAHPYNPDFGYPDDPDERQTLRDLGFRRDQYYNGNCSCEMCWDYRSEYGLTPYDDLIDDNGEHITEESMYHLNPVPDASVCKECKFNEQHFYHTLNILDWKTIQSRAWYDEF